MDVEDELRRVLREENLDVPVRAGAEWSVMAGARRQRHRQNALAALGGSVAATMLAGSAVALINYRAPSPQTPPSIPPAVQSSQVPGQSVDHPRSEKPEGEPDGGQQTSEADDPGQWSEPEYSTTDSEEIPTLLESSVPETTTSEPSSSSSEPETTSEEPSMTITVPDG